MASSDNKQHIGYYFAAPPHLEVIFPYLKLSWLFFSHSITIRRMSPKFPELLPDELKPRNKNQSVNLQVRDLFRVKADHDVQKKRTVHTRHEQETQSLWKDFKTTK